MQTETHETPKNKPNSSSELDRVRAAAEPIVAGHGAELVAVELKTEQGGWILRILVEKAGSAANKASTQAAAVDLEACASISRELSPALDILDSIPQRYSLEVGSPGLERELHGAADFQRFTGNKAKLRLSAAQRGQSVLVGVITGATGAMVGIQDGGASYEVPLADITSAHLVFELTPAQKPGHQKNQNKNHQKNQKKKKKS
ncbi:MAG: ribosome maturation factor RimP [Polyangiaceae bacterium]